ncbi:amidase [Parahaliea mediterranea]|uniref:amidase n=1 Tax=Parahaliea mediterranea TaxID=651086 RepID=UPI000E2EAA52|nr:amidase [Parahaliea mediterranea]
MAALHPALGAGAASQSQLPSDICDMSALVLSAAIRAQSVSCREVMSAYLARIERYNPLYNAIVAMPDGAELLRLADAADRDLARGHYRGWMHGMPHAVKDLSDVAGMVSSGGSPLFRDRIAAKDSLITARMRSAGAIFIGKTNVPEYGLGSQTYNPVYGVTRNAYRPSLAAGGSSGGAAVGLATRMLPVADGSDMMGSLRNPAAFNNVIGFRPTQGRVPHVGGDLFLQQLGYEGPMGRDVDDVVQLLGTLAGADSRAPLSLRDSFSGAPPMTDAEFSALRLGWLGDYNGYLPMEAGLLSLCRRALAGVEPYGIAVEDAAPDYDMDRLWRCWLTLRQWAIAGGSGPLYAQPDKRAQMKPELVWEIENGLRLDAADVAAAGVARSDWYRALLTLFQRYDFLVLPTAQVFPFDAGLHWPKAIGEVKMDTYHRWMEVVIGGTLSGCPVVNLPAGFDESGRPMGVQVIGPFGADARVLSFARAYVQRTEWLAKRPTLQVADNQAQ